NEQVQEAKANLLVHQYEMFKMKEDEDIETMFVRFQTLVSGLQVLKKSYTVPDHVRKILRSLPPKWRPKVTAFQEAKVIKDVTLESHISSLRSHEMELQADEPEKNMKSIALSSIKSSSKPMKSKEVEVGKERTAQEKSDEEMTMIIRRFQQWNRKNNVPNRGSGSKEEEQLKCYNCSKTGHFIAECPDLSLKDEGKRSNSKKKNFKSRVKKSLMAMWEDLDELIDDEGEKEVNLALMANASSDESSDS
ncbi:serine/threonine protein kinase SRPK1, partial [Trifolium medium]|nr:serine/threonine protein kinase SRPK1 [Trifolium medium]